MKASGAAPFRWSMVVESLTRPYPVSLPMLVLVALIPLYVFIPGLMPGRMPYVPELALDRVVPLQPAWSLVYGSLYVFLIILPVLVVRQQEHIRRTVSAYLMVWIAAYVCFLVYPTVAAGSESPQPYVPHSSQSLRCTPSSTTFST